MSVVSSELGISWQEAGLVVVTALAIYGVTLVGARVLGQRQFASLSTHDLVFVFALGSIIGRTVLVRTSLAGAVIGLTTMFAAHTTMSRLYRSRPRAYAAIQNPPTSWSPTGSSCRTSCGVRAWPRGAPVSAEFVTEVAGADLLEVD